MDHEILRDVLSERSEELCRDWLAAHLNAVPACLDDALIRETHGRGPALLLALVRVLEGAESDNWGSFSHREAVQLVVSMASTLSESDGSATTAGSLIPTLGAALEAQGVKEASTFLVPLASVAAEACVAARLAALERRHQDALAATSPVVKLREGLLLVTPCAAPDRETSLAIVDRVLQSLMKQEARSPLVVLDLTRLDDAGAPSVVALLSLVEEVTGLGGSCPVVGLTPELLSGIEHDVVDLEAITRWASVEEGLADVWPEGLLRRIARSFLG